VSHTPPQVAVCGPREATPEEEDRARRVGELLAERGATVVCGGYGGVMAAVAAGARSRGGRVVGILSGADRSGAGPDLDVVVVTGIGEARNAVIVRSADAVIAVGGSWGTLSEIAFAMRRGDVPVVVLGGWRLTDPEGNDVGPPRADTPEAAVAAVLDR
jgi:uncharacterized protein (TIGR00725 family)